MNTKFTADLDFTGFEEYLHFVKINLMRDEEGFAPMIEPSYNAAHYTFAFPNGYGASVSKVTEITCGWDRDLWEVAVLTVDRIENKDWRPEYLETWGRKPIEWDYNITYNTPITNDVIGYITDEEVRNVLKQIKNLPNREDWCYVDFLDKWY